MSFVLFSDRKIKRSLPNLFCYFLVDYIFWIHFYHQDFYQKMKTVAIGLCLVFSLTYMHAQSGQTADHVLEGSKIVVELIKALSSKRDIERNAGCRNTHADICISNECTIPILVTLYKRQSNEIRELIIQPTQRECSLQLGVGVWTYDLRLCDEDIILRKGDLLIEGCQNITLNIKY